MARTERVIGPNVWLMETDGGQTKSKPATFGEFQLLQKKQKQPTVTKTPTTAPPLPATERVIGPNVAYVPKSTPSQQVKARHAQTTQPTSAPRVSGIVPQTTHSVVQPVKTAPTPTTTTPTTTTPTEPERTIEDMIREMIEAQRKARIAELDKARDAALANLESEQSRLQPAYYDARNQAAAQSDLGALNFAQYMASRGVKGGAAGMPEIYRNAALQGEIGALNRQEQMALDAIERDRTGVLSAYEQDRVAALADLDARALQAQIEQMNADRRF